MTKTFIRTSALALLLAAQVASAQSTNDADQRLKALYTAEWDWRQLEFAQEPGQVGRGSAADHLPRVDAAAQKKRLQYWEKTLADLDKIPLQQLSPEEKINAQIFRAVLAEQLVDVRYKTYEAPFNSDTFFWTEFTPREGFANADEYRRYLGRLRDVPRFFDEQTVNMRAGLGRGFTVPKVSVTGRDRTIEPYLKADDSNPLYLPFTLLSSSMPADEQEKMRAAARSVIAEHVVPAYSKLLDFMRSEYLVKARTTLAAEKLPDGKAYYQAMIGKFTTLDLTPQQIHEIGLSEVARIKGLMQTTMQKTGFHGTLPEFMTFLRTDPRFYAQTPHELLANATYVLKKMDGKLKDTIGTLPRFRHGVLPVPASLAPIYTGGRGGLEYCMFNTYNLPARPLYTLPSLALHECTPGHSFQAALSLEGPQRPAFRKEQYFSGYGEGWGLYTEWLGGQIGIYETPYEEFGQLTYEIWRASRLVVDTGIHHDGWSRDQALAYMRDNVPLSEHEITTEVDRYIAWPGQAVAYKLGEMQIRRHRREAEQALGPKFDQRKFHDAILALGAVPLPVLAERMAKFIADGGENPTPTSLADAPPAPPDPARVKFQWGVKIPLRDGVKLNATVYTPRQQKEPAPCVFTLTPYISQSYHDRGIYFASNGYPFLTVDVRGRGNSEGQFRPLIQEARDGHDVVEWLAQQPYCNGKVTMWGGSYAGYDQWATAKEFPPHLATIVPVASPYAGIDFPMRGNIASPYLVQWLTFTSGHASQDRIFGDDAFWRARNREWFESGAPFRQFDEIVGNPLPTFQEWLAHPSIDAYWDSYNPTAEQYAKLSIPILTITGSYDGDQPGAIEHYRQYMKAANAEGRARHYLVIGPWDHAGTRTPQAQFGGLTFGPASLVDIPKLHLDWYAWTMQSGAKPQFLQKSVAYYVMDADKWRYADSLDAVTAESRPYYLDSAANATDVLASGSLGSAQAKGKPDQYVYDPRDVGVAAIEAVVDPASLTDQRLIHALRGKQLVYHTAPFERDTEISGFFKLSTWLAIDQPDTDFAVAVYEVRPDGSSIALSGDVQRARYRESLRTPKLIASREPLRYDFNGFMFVSRMLRQGSRLRLVIGPVNSMYSQKNFNSGGDVSAESMRDARAVTVKLYHDRAHPSALFVPLGQP